jgi:hypothetical protein
MKLFTAILVIAGLFGANALAQTSEADPSANVSLPDDPLAECRGDGIEQCCTDLAGCNGLLDGVAANRGQTPTELAQSDCRDRRGDLDGNVCSCNEPNSWFGTTDDPHQCCVPSVARYERRMHACQDSGGSWTCRGECRCPNQGQELRDGVCVGDATTRQEITDLRRIRDEEIPERERRIAELQRELDAAHAAGDARDARIADLESQLAAARGELDSLRGQLARLNDYIRSQGGTPPLTPPAPLPGTAGAVADAAGGTNSNPLDEVPVGPAETDETWCEANPGWCTLVVIGSGVAAAGLGLGICAAAGCFDEEPHDRIYY